MTDVMSSEQTNTVSLREMMQDVEPEEDQDYDILDTTTLHTGIRGNLEPEVELPPGVDPNATRWIFNPFEIIDLRNEPNGCGMDYIENVVFNRIRSIRTPVGKDIRDTTNNHPVAGVAHNTNNYNYYTRTALMIGLEFEQKQGYKGVVIVDEITGFEDEEAARINTLLFGTSIECFKDFNAPERPCPVLPNLLETLDRNARAAKGDRLIEKIARRLRVAIRLSQQHARDRIEEGQKRIMDDKAVNRFLSHAEQRAYLALGLDVPKYEPVVAGIKQAQSQGQDLVSAVVAGVATAMQHGGSGAAQAPPQVPPPVNDLVTADELDAVAPREEAPPPKPERQKAEKTTMQTGKAKKE